MEGAFIIRKKDVYPLPLKVLLGDKRANSREFGLRVVGGWGE